MSVMAKLFTKMYSIRLYLHTFTSLFVFEFDYGLVFPKAMTRERKDTLLS